MYKELNDMPSGDSISTIEDCIPDIEPESSSLREWHSGYIRSHKTRIALDLDIARMYFEHGCEVLEFGAIPLLFTAALKRSGYRVAGIDINPSRYRGTIDELGLDVAMCDIENERLPFPDNRFNAAVFNELFEHLRINPIFTMREVLRILKPGGILTLSTPNCKSISGIQNYLVRNQVYSCSGRIFDEYMKLETIGHMGHVREYTTTEVIEFLEKIGFELIDVIFRGNYHSRKKRILTKLRRNLRPFVSYVVRKR